MQKEKNGDAILVAIFCSETTTHQGKLCHARLKTCVVRTQEELDKLLKEIAKKDHELLELEIPEFNIMEKRQSDPSS
jgi:hypothetical protein